MLVANRSPLDLSKITYVLLIALLLPAFHPQLPGNTILFDYVNALFICFFLGYCFFTHSFQVALLGPFALILVGSLIGMLNSQNIVTNSLALAQEAYLLLFFLVIYNIIGSRKELTFLLLCLLVSVSLQGILLVLELAEDPATRAQGTFLNPNMAGAFLGMFFFLVFYPSSRRHWMFRAICATAIFAGIVATKSLGATLGVALGAAAVVVLYCLRTNAMNRLRILFVSLGIALALVPIASSISEMDNYGDRSAKSSDTRAEVWAHGIEMLFDNPFGIAVGPAGFKAVGHGPLNKEGTPMELHNDYLAFLVERGIVGFLGLVSLLGSIGFLLRRSWVQASSARETLWVAALCGMFLFTLTNMFAHELMHFRFLWLGFALIAIQARLSMQRNPEPADTRCQSAQLGGHTV